MRETFAEKLARLLPVSSPLRPFLDASIPEPWPNNFSIRVWGISLTHGVAGNIVNEDILGSLEYACNVAGAKLILVLGHTACGAVTAATQRVELGNITALLSKITPVVDSLEKGVAVDEVAEYNVKHSIERIRKESAILKDMEQAGRILIKGAMYDVATGKVRFLD